MPKTALGKARPQTRLASGSGGSSSKVTVHRVPDKTHDYRLNPRPFPALKTEQGVFTTPPYSTEIKGAWRYKDEAAAKESSDAIWALFVAYKTRNDFVGADTARKFIQMGRTRSLRYALRPGGKKYATDPDTGEKKEMKRTGEVYDQGKLDGAGVFERVLKRCWEDSWYADTFERWRKGEQSAVRKAEDEQVHDEHGGAAIKSEKEDAGELVEVKEEEQ